MARRRGHIDIQKALDGLRKGRESAIQVCSTARIGSPAYKLAGAAQEAIDDLVGDLTGDREYLWSSAAKTPPRERSGVG